MTLPKIFAAYKNRDSLCNSHYYVYKVNAKINNNKKNDLQNLKE